MPAAPEDGQKPAAPEDGQMPTAPQGGRIPSEEEMSEMPADGEMQAAPGDGRRFQEGQDQEIGQEQAAQEENTASSIADYGKDTWILLLVSIAVLAAGLVIAKSTETEIIKQRFERYWSGSDQQRLN